MSSMRMSTLMLSGVQTWGQRLASPLSKLRPSWIAYHHTFGQAGSGDVHDEEGPGEELAAHYERRRGWQPLMRNTIVNLGLCHALHNSTKNMQNSLGHWKEFLDEVKLLHQLIGHPARKVRFVEEVFGGSDMYDYAYKTIKSFSATLYEERWGELGTYFKEARPARELVLLYWDERKYCQIGRAHV